jgi:hypothetical protein
MTRRRFGLVALVVAVSGCFTVAGTLQKDGSGKLTLTYVPPLNSTVSSETKRFTSPHVTVETIRIEPKGAVADLRFDDVTKLSTAQGLANVTVTRTRQGTEELLKVLIRNAFKANERELIGRHAREHPEAEGPRFELTLPGPVVEANRGATKTENRVVWKIPLAEYARTDVLDLDVKYKAPEGGEAPAKAPATTAPPPRP